MSYPPPPGGPEGGSEEPANPYGAPQDPPQQPAPPYGEPTYGQPTYGQPGQPGQPAPGQPAYGQPPPPGFGSPYEKPPSQALAIWALVLACIPCLITNLVSVVLAILVLTGKKAGRVLAIIALVVNAVVIIGWVALITLGVMFGSTPIDDLRTGQCFTADGLTDDETGGVRSIEVVECSESHDAEVVGTNELDADEAAGYADLSAEDLCRPLVDADALAASEQDLTVTALTQTTEPSAGDLMVCAAHTRDGASLVGPLG